VSALVFVERPAAGQPEGLLVLHHGRGSDERDMLGLADELDPVRRMHVVAPRAPLELQDWPGYHWYVVPRVGYPDADTFAASFEALSSLHEELWARTGINAARTVLGGFSMGCVMSYALALSAQRPVPAAIIGFSGFVPTVAGWHIDEDGRAGMRALITHGRRDPVISVEFARRARALLSEAGVTVQYREFDGGHHLDPAYATATREWLAATVDAFRPN
jgi:phospholipase/carboxylesterase